MSEFIPKDVFDCDGVQSVFPISFPFAQPTDVWAFLDNTDTGEFRRLVRNQDYTIKGNTLVTRVDTRRQPWPAPYVLTIMRATRLLQPSSQAMSPKVFSNRIDQLTQICQQLKEQLDRTLFVGTEYPPMNLVSKVYAYDFRHSITVNGAVTAGMFHPVNTDYAMPQAYVVVGTMIAPVISYTYWPRDDAAVQPALVMEGSMSPNPANFVTYIYWPREDLQVNGPTVQSGTMVAPIVKYEDWPRDDVQISSMVRFGDMHT